MMGYNHVTTGLLAGLLTAPVVNFEHWSAHVAWVVSVAGAALLPDLDIAGSTAGRMWGPISQAVATAIGGIAGGHRWGTHDLVLAPFAFGLLAAAAFIHPVTAGILLALLIGVSLRGLALCGGGQIGILANLALSGIGAWWLITSGATHLQLVPLVIALGVAVHILGDLVTEEGIPVPILWLRTRCRVSIPVFTVGKSVERLAIAPALSAATLWIIGDQTQILEHAHALLA